MKILNKTGKLSKEEIEGIIETILILEELMNFVECEKDKLEIDLDKIEVKERIIENFMTDDDAMNIIKKLLLISVKGKKDEGR